MLFIWRRFVIEVFLLLGTEGENQNFDFSKLISMPLVLQNFLNDIFYSEGCYNVCLCEKEDIVRKEKMRDI